MFTRIGALFAAAVCFAGVAGCVSADVYRLKEQEVVGLQKVNADIREQNISLNAEKSRLETQTDEIKKENEGLNGRIEKQNEEISYLKDRARRLEKVDEGLRDRVAKLNSKIAALSRENQRLITLSLPENLLRSLGERLTDLQKQVQALTDENQVLKNKPATVRSEEEEAAIRTEGPKTVRSAGGDPQTVRISAGQKAVQNVPDQELQEEEAEQ